VTLKAPVTQRDDWTLATVRAAAEPIAAARGLVVREFMVGGSAPTALRIELLRGESRTCWVELPVAELDAAPAGVTALIEREVTAVVRLRHG